MAERTPVTAAMGTGIVTWLILTNRDDLAPLRPVTPDARRARER
ncbi:MAG TPA: hypothetical protein VH637_15125 [Streptosporangiaceae bacterium]